MSDIIKFIGKINRDYPQMFPKFKQNFNAGEYAILNFEVIKEIEGDIVLNDYGNITLRGNNLPHDYAEDYDKEYKIIAKLDGIHPQYGHQWDSILVMENDFTMNTEEQKTFFSTILTENQTENLFNVFNDPIPVIEDGDKEKLKEVKGIGDITVENLINKYKEHKDFGQAYIELSSYGLGANKIKSLSQKYGSPDILISKIKENPYILIDEVKGIGFKTVDKMALNAGLPKNSDRRLEAFIKYFLKDAGEQGFSWVESEVLADEIQSEFSSFDIDQIIDVVNDMRDRDILWGGEIGKVALQEYYRLEKDIKTEIRRLQMSDSLIEAENWEEKVEEVENIQGWKFTNQQKEGIKTVVNKQVCIITGKSGSGKSSTALGALSALDTTRFAQCSLSGKASARLQEVSGLKAQTIHRLLGYNPMASDPWFYNKDNPLNVEVVILDEFSMIGGRLFLRLLRAIPDGAKLVMLGDQGQLSAIGALNIASDLTHTHSVATVVLDKIHRQAQKSAIITESYKISNGEQIFEYDYTGNKVFGELEDLEIDIYDNKEDTFDKVMSQFKKSYNKNKDIFETQVIVPIRYNGDASVYKFNNAIQKICNPTGFNKPSVKVNVKGDNYFYNIRVGDKIINKQNNYKTKSVIKDDFGGWVEESDQELVLSRNSDGESTTPIFNGFVGEVIDIVKNNKGEPKDLIIYFPILEKHIRVEKYHWYHCKAIHLGYALTAHETQGSEYEICIVGIDYSHYILLNRELLYTAITRARSHAILVGTNDAIRHAIGTSEVRKKQTFLYDLMESV